MTIIEAIILGILQGLTEFLPVSSSGHLVLFSKIFGIENGFLFFSVLLHVATLLAVLIYYRKQIFDIIKKPLGPFALKLYVASLPAIVVALLFSNVVEKMFSGSLLPFSFMFTAVLLVVAQVFSSKQITGKKIDFKGALIMGSMQAVALIPGISRSGSTISGGLVFGYEKKETADFAFLMSVPIILASLAYEILKLVKTGSKIVFVVPTIFGFVFAFFTGLVSIFLMLKAVKKLKLHYFSIYLFALAIASFFII